MCRVGLVLVILFLVGVQEIHSDILQTPYMAALFWLNGDVYEFHCNGAIISSRHVLTTATCAGDKFSYRSIIVRVGSSHHLYGGQEHFVENVNKHFKFSPDLDADIAVLRLSEPLKLSYRVAVVNLPEQDISEDDITKPKVTFYGNDRLLGSALDSLQESTIEYKSNQLDCNNFFNVYFPHKDLVTDNMICLKIRVNQYNRIFGAPWVYNGTIYGIYSWEHLIRTNSNAPRIFTRVAAFTDWIKNWIR